MKKMERKRKRKRIKAYLGRLLHFGPLRGTPPRGPKLSHRAAPAFLCMTGRPHFSGSHGGALTHGSFPRTRAVPLTPRAPAPVCCPLLLLLHVGPVGQYPCSRRYYGPSLAAGDLHGSRMVGVLGPAADSASWVYKYLPCTRLPISSTSTAWHPDHNSPLSPPG
jgi:hypothetical protein